MYTFKLHLFGENIRLPLKSLTVSLILRENPSMVTVSYTLFFFRFGLSNRFDTEFPSGLAAKVQRNKSFFNLVKSNILDYVLIHYNIHV